MKTPLVSVIIPVYNQERWIGRCLRSLMNQSMKREEYELIVVDDGSKDRSDYALELFMDEIVLIKHEKNLGLPVALNKGIKAVLDVVSRKRNLTSSTVNNSSNCNEAFNLGADEAVPSVIE